MCRELYEEPLPCLLWGFCLGSFTCSFSHNHCDQIFLTVVSSSYSTCLIQLKAPRSWNVDIQCIWIAFERWQLKISKLILLILFIVFRCTMHCWEKGSWFAIQVSLSCLLQVNVRYVLELDGTRSWGMQTFI